MKLLVCFEGVRDGLQSVNDSPAVSFLAEHDPAALVGIRRRAVGFDFFVERARKHQRQGRHGQISASPVVPPCQKLSERYFEAESQKIVTTVACRMRDATFIAPTMFAPDESPTSKPSSRASRR